MINLFFIMHDHSGAKTYANELLDYLSTQKKIAVHKVYLESNIYKEYTEIVKNNILNIHIPRVEHNGSLLEKYARRCIDLLNHLLEGKSGLIFHLNFKNQFKLGQEARRRFGAKLVYTLHFLPEFYSYFSVNQTLNRDVEIMDDTFGSLLEKEVDKVICVTCFAKQVLKENHNVPEENIELIYNGYENYDKDRQIPDHLSSEIINIHRDFGLNTIEQIILFVGRLDDNKGIESLISVFKRLISKFPECRLVIAGNGDIKQSLKYANHIWGKVTFTGGIPHEQILKLYKIATIGVIPTLSEQCSYVALEMMSCNLPIVTTTVPGLSEIFLHNENALLIPLKKDEKKLLKLNLCEDTLELALTKLLADVVLRQKVSKNAYQNWSRYYTSNIMGDKTLKVYKNLLKYC